MTSSALASKFRGCLKGALIGDCLGSPYEGDYPISKRVLTNYFSKILKGESAQILPYTDDTAMTISVAKSLIENKKICPKDMAKKFVVEFYNQPKRGYGANVVTVFEALNQTACEDPFLPAKLQFNGTGSYGNGAAMRISPIALFSHEKEDMFIKNAVEQCSFITHTHPNGYNGAILQCLAIQSALKLESTKDLDPVDFISHLENKMESLELKDSQFYYESLKKIKEIFLSKKEDISTTVIAENLGNDVSAHRSVPTAIYSFLRGLHLIPEFEYLNPFMRTMYHAISVGGDTDTIASMAGSIAGAYHGDDGIPKLVQERCESVKEITELADELFTLSQC